MTFIDMLRAAERQNGSMLCVGLDPDPLRFPAKLRGDSNKIYDFCAAIVDATADLAIAFKPQIAYFAAHRAEAQLERLMSHIRRVAPLVPIILDAKRGDIGNTSTMYARAFFDAMNFDAITVSPYMGEDSLRPFLEFENKFVICLALTSNAGHSDFQTLTVESEELKLYERVINTVSKWGNPDQLMFVVGATRAELVGEIRKLIPDHFLLVPGVGAQGGSLSDITHAAANQEVGLLVNSSRGILYASQGEDYADAASVEAAKLASEMSGLMQQLGM
jgi:orotidine-5'-phosphate decarboxylase